MFEPQPCSCAGLGYMLLIMQAFLLDNATHSINSWYTPVKKQAQQTLQKGNGKLNIN